MGTRGLGIQSIEVITAFEFCHYYYTTGKYYFSHTIQLIPVIGFSKQLNLGMTGPNFSLESMKKRGQKQKASRRIQSSHGRSAVWNTQHQHGFGILDYGRDIGVL